MTRSPGWTHESLRDAGVIGARFSWDSVEMTQNSAAAADAALDWWHSEPREYRHAPELVGDAFRAGVAWATAAAIAAQAEAVQQAVVAERERIQRYLRAVADDPVAKTSWKPADALRWAAENLWVADRLGEGEGQR